jgi:hypothetical protein
MDRFSLKHLLDGEVLDGLKANLAKERGALADVLAHLAEVDERKLHVPAGYESLQDYCMRGLHLSKDAANKRIHAARAALKFPAIFEKVAEGALRLTAINILAAYLRPENVEQILAAASFKTDFEVREILAAHFPQESVPTTIAPIADQPTLGPEAAPEPEAGALGSEASSALGTDPVAAQPLQGVVKRPEIMPIAAGLYELRLTMDRAMLGKLRQVQNLFGRRKPVPDEAEILELGLDLLVARLEKKKFAARIGRSPGGAVRPRTTSRPR